MSNLSIYSLQGLLLLFFDKRDDFGNKNEGFYNPSIIEILVTINGRPYQLFAGGLQARDIYPELKKYFYKKNFNVTWEHFLTTKLVLWIDTVLTTRFTAAVDKSGILIQIEKAPEASNGDLTYYVFSLEDAVAYLSVVTNTIRIEILTIEK